MKLKITEMTTMTATNNRAKTAYYYAFPEDSVLIVVSAYCDTSFCGECLIMRHGKQAADFVDLLLFALLFLPETARREGQAVSVIVIFEKFAKSINPPRAGQSFQKRVERETVFDQIDVVPIGDVRVIAPAQAQRLVGDRLRRRSWKMEI